MDGNIESAAKKFGIFLIVATVILVLGLNRALTRSSERLGSAVIGAGSEARPAVPAAFPPKLWLELNSAGPFQIDLSPNNKELRVAPVRVELSTVQED